MASDYFKDVGENAHTDDIDWAKERGISKGSNPPDNDEFSPYATVTRQQMATFIRRAVTLVDPALGERLAVEPPPIEPPPIEPPPIEPPPTGMFIPKLQGPVLKHDGNPTVMSGFTHNSGTRTIRNALIRGRVYVLGGTLLFEDCEFDGQGGDSCVFNNGGKVTLRRCELHGAEDGIKNNVDTEQCTIHNPTYKSGSHGDCVQLQNTFPGTATHRFSYFDCREGSSSLGNAAFQVKKDFGSGTQNLLVEDCYIDGGNLTVNLTSPDDVRFRRCLWGGHSRYGVGGNGADEFDVQPV